MRGWSIQRLERLVAARIAAVSLKSGLLGLAVGFTGTTVGAGLTLGAVSTVLYPREPWQTLSTSALLTVRVVAMCAIVAVTVGSVATFRAVLLPACGARTEQTSCVFLTGAAMIPVVIVGWLFACLAGLAGELPGFVGVLGASGLPLLYWFRLQARTLRALDLLLALPTGRRCEKCGYLRRGLRAGSACPECGAAGAAGPAGKG